jgi:hypothetical protein
MDAELTLMMAEGPAIVADHAFLPLRDVAEPNNAAPGQPFLLYDQPPLAVCKSASQRSTREIEALAASDEKRTWADDQPGIDPLVATALLAAAGNGQQFKTDALSGSGLAFVGNDPGQILFEETGALADRDSVLEAKGSHLAASHHLITDGMQTL